MNTELTKQSSYNKAQTKALEKVIELNNQIADIQRRIQDTLSKNWLNILDIEKYEHDKNIDQFLQNDLP